MKFVKKGGMSSSSNIANKGETLTKYGVSNRHMCRALHSTRLKVRRERQRASERAYKGQRVEGKHSLLVAVGVTDSTWLPATYLFNYRNCFVRLATNRYWKEEERRERGREKEKATCAI